MYILYKTFILVLENTGNPTNPNHMRMYASPHFPEADIYNKSRVKYWVEDTCRASFKASQLVKQREEVSYEQEVQEEDGAAVLGMDVDFNPGGLAVDAAMPSGSAGGGAGSTALG